MMHFTLKNFLSVACLGMAGVAMAQTEAPVFDWANYLQTQDASGTQIKSVTYDADGVSYWMGSASTAAVDEAKNTYPQVMINGIDIFNGEPKVGSAAAANFVLFKADATGHFSGSIHSTKGDYTSTSQGDVAVTKDGIFFATSVRQYQAGVKSNLFDTKGNTIEFGDAVEDAANRYYTAIVASATKEGEIKWVRHIDVAHGDKIVKDVISVKGFAVTESGNMVLVAQVRDEFYVPTATGTQTVKPTADKQAAVIVLDADGYYLNHFFPQGEGVDESSVLYVKSQGDEVYFAGTVKPATEAVTLSFGEQELKTGVLVSSFAAKASIASLKEGKFDWLTSFPTAGVGGKAAYNDPKLMPGVDCFWFTCGFNGVISLGDTEISSTQGNMREGLVVKISKDGSVVKGALSKTDFSENYLTVYEGVLQCEASKAYVYGYAMNAASGVFLREYDAETLVANKEAAWVIVAGGATISSTCYAYNPTDAALYSGARSNKPFAAMGKDQTQAVTSWTSMCAKFTLPDALKAGIGNVTVGDAEPVQVTVADGAVVISSAKAATVHVYDVAGRCVASVAVAPDAPATVALPAGIYIAAGVKVAVR